MWHPIRRLQVRWSCPHPTHRVACLHGDEITHAGGRRGYCEDCGRWFRTLPDWCSHARRPHGTPSADHDW